MLILYGSLRFRQTKKFNKIQELKTAIQWVGGQLIDSQKQVLLN